MDDDSQFLEIADEVIAPNVWTRNAETEAVYRDDARKALSAAYPLIRDQVLAEVREALEAEARRFEEYADSGQHSAFGEAHFRNKAKTIRGALATLTPSEDTTEEVDHA